MGAVPKPKPGHVSRAKRLAPYRKEQRRLVMLRAGVDADKADRALPWGKCEGCWRYRQLEWAHLAGRGNQVSEPWASSAALTSALCHRCHADFDGHLESSWRILLMVEGETRLAEHLNIDARKWKNVIERMGGEPLNVIKALISLADPDHDAVHGHPKLATERGVLASPPAAEESTQ